MSFSNYKTTQNNKCTILSRYLPFQTVNLPFQTVNLSFYLVLKTNKNSDKFIVFYRFSSKNPTQNNKFIVLCRFCLDKITATQHSQKQLSFEWYNNFFVIVLCRFVVLVKKKCYRRPLISMTEWILHRQIMQKKQETMSNWSISSRFYVHTCTILEYS